MRSKTLCLLVCLTSCLLELPTCLADAPPTAPEPYVEPDWFCSKGEIKPDPPAVIPPDRKHGVDCYDKPISVDDFKWNLATSFNEQKEVPKSEHVEIDIHRALLIEAGATDVVIKLTATDNEQCKSILVKRSDAQNDQEWKLHQLIKAQPGASPPTPDVGTLTVSVTAEKKMIIAVFEPECRLYAERPGADAKVKRLHHLFMRNLKTIAFPKEVLDITNADNAERGLGGFIIPTDIEEEDNLPDKIKEPNLFFPLSEIKSKYMSEGQRLQCNHMCQLGKVFKLERTGGAAAWANTFKLHKSCEWMTVHLNTKNLSQATEISLRHGFVTLPTQVKAYPMDFEKNEVKGDQRYEVIVAFYPSKIGDSETYFSNLIVANRHGRSLRASEFTSSDDLIFAFSHEECLSDVIGSKAANKKLTKYDFNKDLNLAYRAANKEGGYTLYRYIGKTLSNEDRAREAAKYERSETVKDMFPDFIGQETPIVYVTKPPRPVDTPPTGATYGPNDTAATEPPPPTIHTNNEEIEKLRKEQELQRLAFEKAMNSGNKKYQYWAIPAGFATGSFASFLIANIILFIMKRTVLTFWYKAMYKRYGSDTTMGAGTTMGKTGAGETVGGGTTIGGGTTMGGTTAGETGSTTAA